MSISIENVEHIAKLARLFLSNEEKELYTKQLSRIIDNFNELQALDTNNVEPMAGTLPIVNVVREDIVKQDLKQKELMKNAPKQEGGFFKVPKISD